MTAADPRVPLMVRRIDQVDAHHFEIEWSDDRVSRWRLSQLRRNCPCASCRDEWTGKQLLDPESIPDDIQCSVVQSVGRYALAIHFDDDHATGIYTFQYLRELEEQATEA